MLLMKAIPSVLHATNHFSGIIKQNNVKNVQPLSSMMPKFQNVFVLYKRLINTTAGVSSAKSRTFGTPRPNNVSGVLKPLFIKKLVEDVSALQATLIYQMEAACNVPLRNIGIIGLSYAKDAQTHLLMISRSSNVYVQQNNLLSSKGDAYHAISLIIGTQTQANVSRVLLLSITTKKQGDAYVLLLGHILSTVNV